MPSPRVIGAWCLHTISQPWPLIGIIWGGGGGQAFKKTHTKKLGPNSTPRDFDVICLGADNTKNFKVSPGDSKMQLRTTDSELVDFELYFQYNRAFKAIPRIGDLTPGSSVLHLGRWHPASER